MHKMKKFMAVLVAIAALSCGWAALAGGAELGFYQQGDKNLNGPVYDWWYGCSPTSAGMMMGYYDIHGYGGLNYGNLVPNGVAEATTFPPPGYDPWNYLANKAIASQGNVTDFYSAGYGNSGDDATTNLHTFNCLADFMGTSQDSAGNTNGSTTFYFWTNGAKTYARNVIGLPDGMLGMDEYFQYAHYGSGDITTDTSFYTQLIKSPSAPLGCTFAAYKALINAGLVVMIQVEGHSMFGYGYDDQMNIIFHDTWDGLEHFMAWGGSYSGMKQWGITVFTPSGGVVPLPSSLLLMISGLAGLVGFRLRK